MDAVGTGPERRAHLAFGEPREQHLREEQESHEGDGGDDERSPDRRADAPRARSRGDDGRGRGLGGGTGAGVAGRNVEASDGGHARQSARGSP
jgi:hypothetical protein